MKSLTVLYDPHCALCRQCRDWLIKQPKYLHMDFVPQGTPEADTRFASLHVGPDDPLDDLIVVSDEGRVYRSTRAWIMCFYALRNYRPLAFRLSSPALMPLARRAYQAIARHRLWLSGWFGGGCEVSDKVIAHRITYDTTDEPTTCLCNDDEPKDEPCGRM